MTDPELPPWLQFLSRNRLRGAIPRGVGATMPRFAADASRPSTLEERERAAAAPSLLERIQTSAGNVARQVAEHPVRTAADLTPGVGDALALKDAFDFAKGGQPWMAGLAAASVLPGVPAVVKKAKGVPKAGFDAVLSSPPLGSAAPSPLVRALTSGGDEALSVLHNTNARNVGRIAELGGIPAPSLAVVRADAPFTHYGDMSLIGTERLVDPKAGPVSVFDGDAYTIRQPQPETIPLDADGLSEFAERIGFPSRDGSGYAPGMVKGLFEDDPRSFGSSAGMLGERLEVQKAFLRSRGIDVPEPPKGLLTGWDGTLDELNAAIKAHREEVKGLFQELDYPDTYSLDRRFGIRPAEVAREWVRQEALRANVHRGLGMRDRSGKWVPYNLDNLTERMVGNGRVRLQETNKLAMLDDGPGPVAAKHLKQLRSVDQLRAAAAQRLRNEAAETAGKKVAGGALRRFQDVSGGWGNSRALNLALSRVKRTASPDEIAEALRKVGVEQVTPEMGVAGREYLDALMDVPQAYFEAKPRRPVRLEEFPGAVVPRAEIEQVGPILERSGVEVRPYGDFQERKSVVAALRRELAAKGHRTLFSLAPLAAAGMLAKYGLTMDDPALDDL